MIRIGMTGPKRWAITIDKREIAVAKTKRDAFIIASALDAAERASKVKYHEYAGQSAEVVKVTMDDGEARIDTPIDSVEVAPEAMDHYFDAKEAWQRYAILAEYLTDGKDGA